MQEVWNHVRDLLLETIGPNNTSIWLNDVRIRTMKDGEVVLEVPHRFHGDWIADNYLRTLDQAFSQVLRRAVKVRLEIRSDPAPVAGGPAPRAAEGPSPVPAPEPAGEVVVEAVTTPRTRVGPNPEKTFENFVVGACNEFAHGAAISVADFPGGQYNPLFLYGGTGLGKTHLLHAIGNRIQEQDASARVVYVTAEQFMNEMITAIRYNRAPEFRDRYRAQAHVLLVDDIQFLAKKMGTQEEFFHTFEALQTSGRQIVMTADMLPREIEGLEERLRTRFSSGLEADLQPPDTETMLAILHQKAQDLGLVVPNDAALYIANGVRSNIRELEGALKRLAAITTLYHEPVTYQTVRTRLPHLGVAEHPVITPEQILRAVARMHNVKVSDLTGPSHEKRLVRPRHVAVYLIREHTDLSFPDIGRVMGDRDSSTIQYAYRKITGLRQKDPDVASLVEVLERGLTG